MVFFVKLASLTRQVVNETLLRPTAFGALHHPIVPESETTAGMFRILLTWLAYFFGAFTLQDVGVILAMIFTALQIVVLLRDKFGLFKRKESK